MNRVALAALFACGPIGAQSLQILPSPPTGTESTSFHIMIVSPPGRAPAALQWRISTPDPLDIIPQKIHAGDAAQAGMKTLSCAGPEERKDGAITCILSGGVQRIPNGAVAVVRLTIPKDLDTAKVRVDRVLGVSPDGKALPMADVEATLPLVQEKPRDRQ